MVGWREAAADEAAWVEDWGRVRVSQWRGCVGAWILWARHVTRDWAAAADREKVGSTWGPSSQVNKSMRLRFEIVCCIFPCVRGMS